MKYLLLLLATFPLVASKTPAQLLTDYNKSGLPGKTRALSALLALNPADVPDKEFEKVAVIVQGLQKSGSSIISGLTISPAWKAALAKSESAQTSATESAAKTSKARDEKYAAADKSKAQRLPEDIVKSLEHEHGANNEKRLLEYIAKHPEATEMVDEEGNNALILALMSKKPSLPVIRELIKRTKNIEHRNDDGETPLMAAAMKGIEKAVTLLLERGANIHAKDNDGATPLMYAAMGGQNTNIINLLLKKGARINERDNDGYTALHNAIFWDLHPKSEGVLCYHCQEIHNAPPSAAQQAETVQLLLDRGANIESKTTGTAEAPLMRAVSAGNIPVVKVLLANKADTEATDTIGSTPLKRAIESRAGFSFYKDLPAQQQLESREAYLQIIKLLLQARANPNAVNMYNQSAIISAIIKEDAAVVRELLVHGAQNKATTAHNWGPLEIALRQQKNRPADDTPEKQRAINEIVDMLLHTKELIAQYKESQAEKRAAHRALGQHGVIPEISEIIGEFVTEPKVKVGQSTERVAIIDTIKTALRRNDGDMLIELFTKEPHLLEIADEDGNTPLFLALHYQEHSPYRPGTKNALNIIISALRAADEKAEGKHHYLAKALEHKNRQGFDAITVAKKLELPKPVTVYLESQKKGAGK
jgi:ankyrin repeat protein